MTLNTTVSIQDLEETLKTNIFNPNKNYQGELVQELLKLKNPHEYYNFLEQKLDKSNIHEQYALIRMIIANKNIRAWYLVLRTKNDDPLAQKILEVEQKVIAFMEAETEEIKIDANEIIEKVGNLSLPETKNKVKSGELVSPQFVLKSIRGQGGQGQVFECYMVDSTNCEEGSEDRLVIMKVMINEDQELAREQANSERIASIYVNQSIKPRPTPNTAELTTSLETVDPERAELSMGDTTRGVLQTLVDNENRIIVPQISQIQDPSALTANNKQLVKSLRLPKSKSVVVIYPKADQTLEEIIGDKEQNLGETLTRVFSILRTVGQMHATGVVHRDLKPENIMERSFKVGKSEHRAIKLIDMGLNGIANTNITVQDLIVYMQKDDPNIVNLPQDELARKMGDIIQDENNFSQAINTIEGTIQSYSEKYAHPNAVASREKLEHIPTSPQQDLYSVGLMALEMLLDPKDRGYVFGKKAKNLKFKRKGQEKKFSITEQKLDINVHNTVINHCLDKMEARLKQAGHVIQAQHLRKVFGQLLLMRNLKKPKDPNLIDYEEPGNYISNSSPFAVGYSRLFNADRAAKQFLKISTGGLFEPQDKQGREAYVKQVLPLLRNTTDPEIPVLGAVRLLEIGDVRDSINILINSLDSDNLSDPIKKLINLSLTNHSTRVKHYLAYKLKYYKNNIPLSNINRGKLVKSFEILVRHPDPEISTAVSGYLAVIGDRDLPENPNDLTVQKFLELASLELRDKPNRQNTAVWETLLRLKTTSNKKYTDQVKGILMGIGDEHMILKKEKTALSYMNTLITQYQDYKNKKPSQLDYLKEQLQSLCHNNSSLVRTKAAAHLIRIGSNVQNSIKILMTEMQDGDEKKQETTQNVLTNPVVIKRMQRYIKEITQQRNRLETLAYMLNRAFLENQGDQTKLKNIKAKVAEIMTSFDNIQNKLIQTQLPFLIEQYNGFGNSEMSQLIKAEYQQWPNNFIKFFIAQN